MTFTSMCGSQLVPHLGSDVILVILITRHDKVGNDERRKARRRAVRARTRSGRRARRGGGGVVVVIVVVVAVIIVIATGRCRICRLKERDIYYMISFVYCTGCAML